MSAPPARGTRADCAHRCRRRPHSPTSPRSLASPPLPTPPRRRRLYRSLYDAPNFAAKVASIASMTKICEPTLAAPPADRCCASQDAVLDGAAVLADAFELVRFSNPSAEGVGLSLSTLLDAIEKVAAGGDPADRESQPELAWAGWRRARERPAAPALHRRMRAAPACRGRAPACRDAPPSPAAARRPRPCRPYRLDWRSPVAVHAGHPPAGRPLPAAPHGRAGPPRQGAGQPKVPGAARLCSPARELSLPAQRACLFCWARRCTPACQHTTCGTVACSRVPAGACKTNSCLLGPVMLWPASQAPLPPLPPAAGVPHVPVVGCTHNDLLAGLIPDAPTLPPRNCSWPT